MENKPIKLIYCIASLYNPGGMERVMLNKVTWLSDNGYDVAIVTTEQRGRPPFYPFPESVRMMDLGINYSEDNGRDPVAKIMSYFYKRRLHKKKLSSLLKEERADIVISLYPSESSFIPGINDGSKKILELHYNRYFRLQYNRKGLLGLADRYRSWKDKKIAQRFDKFVVLTREDAEQWGKLDNLEVIPNAAVMDIPSKPIAKKRSVVAVGRLDYQKGFDRLISAWGQLPRIFTNGDFWHLDIYGQGEWQGMLEEQIAGLPNPSSVTIHPPVQDIASVYAQSEFLVMTSHYEGLPMVMIEAMSCGLPVVSFDFSCGPRDIIEDGENGLLVSEGDISGLAMAMSNLMSSPGRRERMGERAQLIREKYSQHKVMRQWQDCFKSIL